MPQWCRICLITSAWENLCEGDFDEGDVTRPTEEAIARDLARLRGVSPEYHLTSRIEASAAGGFATLRGEVASERDRTLIERLVLFEPGISAVRNDLKVVPPQSDSASPPPGARDTHGAERPAPPA